MNVLSGNMRLGSQVTVVSSSIDFIISVSVELKEKRNYRVDYPPQKAPLGKTSQKSKSIWRIASSMLSKSPLWVTTLFFSKICNTVSKSDLFQCCLDPRPPPAHPTHTSAALTEAQRLISKPPH